MKSILNTAAVVAVLAVSAMGAQAQVNSAEAGYATDVANAQSTMSRQQVINEYLTARKNGKGTRVDAVFVVQAGQVAPEDYVRKAFCRVIGGARS